MTRLRMRLPVGLAVLTAGLVRAADPVDIVSPDKPNGGWTFGNGPEFPGATGSLATEPDPDRKDGLILKLSGDLSKGGNYVQAGRDLPDLPMAKLSFKVKAPDHDHLTVRINDKSDQCHQINVNLNKSDAWQTIEFPVAEFFKKMGTSAAIPVVSRYEKWGGANDGRWHDPATSISFLTGRTPKAPSATIWLRDLFIHSSVGLTYAEDFEQAAALPKGWDTKGDVKVAAEGAFKGKMAVKLQRSLDNLQQETSASGAVFPAVPGYWDVSGAARVDLNSPDASYNGTVSLQALGAGGSVLESAPLFEPFRKTDWQTFQKRVELPEGTTGARFTARINKADGAFWVDELSAVQSPPDTEKRIDRIVLSTDRMGNMLLPEDKPLAHVRVRAVRELKDDELDLSWTLRDYWGAEQAEPAKAALQPRGRENNMFVYTTDLDLSGVNIELARFYELHVEVPRKGGEPDVEYTGIARLPVAATKQHKPEEIPFTIRNWDSRITEYFHLSDRIGIRMLGIWGGWDPKPPYKPYAPGIDTCKRLDAKWLTVTPAANIENEGFKTYDETALRQGMQNFLKAYANQGLGFIALGNEPHGKIEKVRDNVKAYRCIYEEVKKFDTNIVVISTSVEPNEDYFREGYYNYLDIYDFHVYETYQDMRNAMREYKKLMAKYNAVKPIFSTEIGLNSQGMTRYVVAIELIKKFASFFAEGGVNVSWFTIQYPDPDGKARGTSGDAHCVFDCKYSQYNPRIDAVAYYHMVNGICVKTFTGEKKYPDETEAYLFRDKQDRCLQILWNETGRKDVTVPLAGVASVELIRIDGGKTTLTPEPACLTVAVSPEPILLFYTQKDAKLADSLASPRFAMAGPVRPVAHGASTTLKFSGDGITPETLRITVPPLWKSTSRQAGKDVECVVTAPKTTSTRECRVLVQKLAGGNPCGEIVVSIPVMTK